MSTLESAPASPNTPNRTHRLQDKLAGHWWFGMTYGDYACDSSLTQGEAIVTGNPRPVLADVGLLFSGVNGHAQNVAVGQGPGNAYQPYMQVTLWIRAIPSAVSGSWLSYGKWGQNVSPAFGCFSIQRNSNQVDEVMWNVTQANNANHILASPNNSVTPGIPCDFCGTYDGISQVLYLDGVQVNQANVMSGPLSQTYLTHPTGLNFGSSQNSTHRWGGEMIEARLYHRALAPDEVAELTTDRHADYRVELPPWHSPAAAPPATHPHWALGGRVVPA